MAGIWVGGGALFMASAAGAIFWLFRVVSARRLNAAVNAYAERENAKTRRAAR